MPSMPSAQLIPPPSGNVLDELPLRPVGVVGGPQVDAEGEVDQGRDQRDPARAIGLEEQAQHARDQRQGDQDGEQRQSAHLAHQIAQLAAPIRPSSITSA